MINEKISQPIRSSNMAEAIMIIPILVLKIFMSINIRAITGSAEIDMAVPKNKLYKNLSFSFLKNSG
jgi:hypothetical protein